MVDSVWRARAKVVGNVELVLISLTSATQVFGMLLSILGAVGIGIIGTSAHHDPSESAKIDLGTAAYDIVIIGLMAVENGLQILAAVKLLTASEFVREPTQALKNARLWKWITIVLIVLNILVPFAYRSSIADILPKTIFVIWRGVHLYIVNNFIKDLEEIVSSQTRTHQTPAEPKNLLAKQ